jgi:hypothetical protein
MKKESLMRMLRRRLKRPTDSRPKRLQNPLLKPLPKQAMHQLSKNLLLLRALSKLLSILTHLLPQLHHPQMCHHKIK